MSDEIKEIRDEQKDIRDEQINQKISLTQLTGEVTRLVTSVAELVDSEKRNKDRKIDWFTDIIKSVILLIIGYAFAQMK